MITLNATKTVVGLVASAGAGEVVKQFVKQNIVTETATQKALVYIGRVGIGSVVGVAVARRTHEVIDNLATAWQKFNTVTPTP